MELKELRSEIKNCKKCQLHKTRSQAVPNEGNKRADIMFVGKKVGKKDDRIGLPYKGEAGKVLDSVLEKLELDRSEVFLTNLTRCYTGGRDPKEQEFDRCAPYLKKELEIVDPEYIVALGKMVSERLLGEKIKVKEEHGSIHKYNTLTYNGKLLLTYNVGAVLRESSRINTIVEDVKKIL